MWQDPMVIFLDLVHFRKKLTSLNAGFSLVSQKLVFLLGEETEERKEKIVTVGDTDTSLQSYKILNYSFSWFSFDNTANLYIFSRGDLPVCTTCGKAQMMKEYTSKDLFLQMSYFESLFDVEGFNRPEEKVRQFSLESGHSAWPAFSIFCLNLVTLASC